MRPPLRSIRHTKNPRTDHDTSNLTRVPEFGSIADSSHSHVTTQIVMPPWRAGNSQAATKGKHEEQTSGWALVMGGRPSFPPPPVLGRSMLGAVDMPIGCALIFCPASFVSVLFSFLFFPPCAFSPASFLRVLQHSNRRDSRRDAAPSLRATAVTIRNQSVGLKREYQSVEIKAWLGVHSVCVRAAAPC